MTNEQKLVNIMFEVALTIHSTTYFDTMTREEVAEWVSLQLKHCGFETQPIGSTWGVLKDL